MDCLTIRRGRVGPLLVEVGRGGLEPAVDAPEERLERRTELDVRQGGLDEVVALREVLPAPFGDEVQRVGPPVPSEVDAGVGARDRGAVEVLEVIRRELDVREGVEVGGEAPPVGQGLQVGPGGVPALLVVALLPDVVPAEPAVGLRREGVPELLADAPALFFVPIEVHGVVPPVLGGDEERRVHREALQARVADRGDEEARAPLGLDGPDEVGRVQDGRLADVEPGVVEVGVVVDVETAPAHLQAPGRHGRGARREGALVHLVPVCAGLADDVAEDREVSLLLDPVAILEVPGPRVHVVVELGARGREGAPVHGDPARGPEGALVAVVGDRVGREEHVLRFEAHVALGHVDAGREGRHGIEGHVVLGRFGGLGGLGLSPLGAFGPLVGLLLARRLRGGGGRRDLGVPGDRGELGPRRAGGSEEDQGEDPDPHAVPL